MKRYLPILLTIILMLTVVGCRKNEDLSQQSSQQDVTDTTAYYISPSVRERLEPYFDLDKVHRPTEADILSIKKGMHIVEVIEVLGKPHWVSDGNNLSLIWESIEGKMYSLLFLSEDHTSDDISLLEHEMTHSVVIREALPLPPKTNSGGSSTEPSTPSDPPSLTEPTDSNFP